MLKLFLSNWLFNEKLNVFFNFYLQFYGLLNWLWVKNKLNE